MVFVKNPFRAFGSGSVGIGPALVHRRASRTSVTRDSSTNLGLNAGVISHLLLKERSVSVWKNTRNVKNCENKKTPMLFGED
jgi:hypothetical protein